MKNDGTTTIQNLLQERFNLLRSKNPSYSVRAFAQKLGIASGTLSLVLLGKRRVSRKLAEKICQKLFLDPIAREGVLNKFKGNKLANEAGTPLRYLQISADQFQTVSEWHYFAILNLVETHDFKNDPKWIARRLGLPLEKVKGALERLFRLELLVESNDQWVRGAPRYSSTDDVQNLGLKSSHYQNLNLAEKSLDRDPITSRDFTWLTLPMDLSRIPEAKRLVRKFQDELSEAMTASSPHPTEVYRMAIQFFPLTVLNSSGEKV